ncbi:pyridoxal phosphate-dependent aminotransferase [Streptomyces sp. NPDC004752]
MTSGIRDQIKQFVQQGRSIHRLDAGEVAFPPPAIDDVFLRRDPQAQDPYGPPLGLAALRSRIADQRGSAFPRGLSADDILITSGAKQAVFLAASVLGGPGCDVLVPAPYWVSYPPMLQLTGGKAIVVPTRRDDGFKVNPDLLDRHVTDSTTAILLNSPANPTGALYTLDELEAIAMWAHQRHIWIISDEIYRQITFNDGGPAPSLADVSTDVNYVIVDGLSKAYALAGWRVGWLIAPSEVLSAAKSVMSHTTSHASNFPQHIAEHALADDAYVSDVRRELRRRRDILLPAIHRAGLPVLQPEGSIYAFPSIEPLLGRTIGGIEVLDDTSAAAALLAGADIASVPGSAFGIANHLRLGFGRPAEELEAAGEALAWIA